MIQDNANAGYDNREEKSEEDIKALLDESIRSALNYDATYLKDKRSKALEYYQGIMRDVPAPDGRSQVVTKDVSTVIGWMLPGIIRTFTQSGRMVDYEPVNEDDEATADQASDYINHKFLKDNDGYRILYSSIHDALLMGNGIIKCWWDDTPETETYMYTGLTEQQLNIIMQEDDVEILAQDTYEEQFVDPSGQDVEGGVAAPTIMYNIKLQRTVKSGGIKFAAVEPEDFLMDKEAVTIEESRFVAHRQEMTKSDLVEMGYDRDIVDLIPTDSVSTFDQEDIVRNFDAVNITDTSDDSVQLVEVFECYVKMDVDGDGVAETVKATYAGNHGAGELLDWEIWEDDYPFVDIPCEPIPHRFDAQSIADQVMDLQRIKTVLSRQMLDNVYAHNNPQMELEEGSVLNKDAITSPKWGQPIIKRRGSLPIAYRDTPFVADKALLAISSVDEELERRTGVSRSTMALDPDALQNQTATAVNAQKDASYSKVELVSRNIAELGLRNLFRKALKLSVKHQDRAEMIRLRGTWVEVDPRAWNSKMDCTINVGLGTGSRERDIAALNQTLGLQMNFLDRLQQQNMVSQGLEMVPKIIRTATKIAESSGLRNGEDYYIKVDEQQLQQMSQQMQQQMQQPSPEEKKAQAEMQLEEKRIQLETQQAQVEHQGKMAIEEKRIEQHIVREREQLQADMQTKTYDADLKAQYQAKEIDAKREADLRSHEIKLAELELKRMELEWRMEEGTAKIELDSAKTADQFDLEYERLDTQEDIAKMQKQGQNKGVSDED